MDRFGDSPIYTVRGAQPRPVPTGAATGSSWRGTTIVVGLMFGWMILIFALATIAAPNDPDRQEPVMVAHGVAVTPASGWFDASDVWDLGATGVSLQKSGVYVAFWAAEYSGTNQELLDEQLSSLRDDFSSYRVLPASPTTVAGGVPGLTSLVTGVSEIWGRENEVVVATSGGVAVVMLATARAGRLAQAQDDLDAMLRSLVMPR